MLSLFFDYQKKLFKKFFQTRRTAKAITIALFCLVLGAVGTGIYFFLVEGFYFIGRDPYFRQALTLYFYELYFLFISLLIVVSVLITALFALFKNRNDLWIISSPRYALMPVFIFFRAVQSSLWPLFVIVLPALLAMEKVFGLGAAGLAMSALAVLFYTLLLVSLVFLLIFAVSQGLYALPSRIKGGALSLNRLTAALIAVLALTVVIVWQQSVNRDLVALFRAQDLESAAADIKAVNDAFTYFPSHLAAKSLFLWQNGQTAPAFALFTVLFVLTGALVYFSRQAGRFFLPVWQRLQEGSYSAGADGSVRARPKRLSHFPPRPVGAIFKKEFLVARRNPRTMLWLIFLLLVWLMQAGLNIVASSNIARYELGGNIASTTVQIMQFMTAVYFMSALVLRFVFPAFSSERKTAWILLSAPLSNAKMFWSKYLFYVPALTIAGLVIGYGNLLLLNIPAAFLLISLFLFAVALFFVVTFGLALGALFPNFETDDPSLLSTSLPGLGFILGSIVYGALGGLSLYTALGTGSFWWALGFIVFSLAAAAMLMYLAPRALARVEYVKSAN
ncbi:MAG: ABC transporter permease [Planctomycetes bacterium]|jgi:ABC-2 type transport system permease protein|nr:ABC transporter permease [Planctomycetota bacterium]